MMKNYLLQLKNKLDATKNVLLNDPVLKNDIDFTNDFLLPFVRAEQPEKIKLIIIGQDPTVKSKESRRNIKTTLNLDKNSNLKRYINKVCNVLNVDIESEVYATNLYKCFFNFPPAKDSSILTRHFKIWYDILLNEVSEFKNAIVITLGEPVLSQLVCSGNKKIKYYWDYIRPKQSGMNFKCSEPFENYLQRRVYPIAHQPTWNRILFYKDYLNSYLAYLMRNEKANMSNTIKNIDD